jgi:hypothetical protein
LGVAAVVVAGVALCVVVALRGLAGWRNEARRLRGRCLAGRAADVWAVELRGDGADGGAALAVRAWPGKVRAAALANNSVSATVVAASVRLIHRRRRSPALRWLLRWACWVRFTAGKLAVLDKAAFI